MGLKSYKAVTPTQRFKTSLTFEEITTCTPEKSLLSPLKKKGGRNSYGRITVRRRGGGHKRKYRIIDFKRDKYNITGTVKSIEYDPNRSAHIALIQYIDGEKRYILAPLGLNVGDMVQSGENAEMKVGNALPLRKMPLGSTIHNVELIEKRGGVLARGAGTSIQLMAKEGKYAIIKLPSGEVRMVSLNCYATLGQLGNIDHENVSIGKAGRNRWKGKRPKVRGVAMNPIDHPMGGGEGKASGGRHPCSPWGKITKGLKTRRKKQSDRLIIKRKK